MSVPDIPADSLESDSQPAVFSPDAVPGVKFKVKRWSRGSRTAPYLGRCPSFVRAGFTQVTFGCCTAIEGSMV